MKEQEQQQERMINSSSSSSSGDAGAGAGSSSGTGSGIQFRMTVKLDFEGRVPSSSEAQSACAAAASSSTQDLLLKLQPLLPHLCITTRSSVEAEQEAGLPPAEVRSSVNDERGLELSLGLPGNSEANRREPKPEPEPELEPEPEPEPGILLQASNAWLSEEQRLKREAQFQKRQEARKKRKILIDEQKRLKCSRSGGSRESEENPGRRGMRSSGSSSRLSRRNSCSSALIDGAAQRLGVRKKVFDDEKSLETKQVSLNYHLSSPPQLPPESVSSSLTSAIASSSFAVPAPVSPNKVQPQAQDCAQLKPHHQEAQAKAPQVSSPTHGASSPLHDCSNRAEVRGVLLRSTSVGAGFIALQHEKNHHHHHHQQQQQQQRSIEMPSPVRSSNNSSLLRTLSEGAAMRSQLLSGDQRHFCWRRTPQRDDEPEVHPKLGSSAFRSPKRESLAGGGSSLTSNPSVNQASSSGAPPAQLPWVTATGTRTVSGVLLAYKKGDVRIVCSCHGQHMTAKEFVQHAGGGDVPNPEKCIVVSPSKSLSFNSFGSSN